MLLLCSSNLRLTYLLSFLLLLLLKSEPRLVLWCLSASGCGLVLLPLFVFCLVLVRHPRAFNGANTGITYRRRKDSPYGRMRVLAPPISAIAVCDLCKTWGT
jgi:hypothetical protein